MNLIDGSTKFCGLKTGSKHGGEDGIDGIVVVLIIVGGSSRRVIKVMSSADRMVGWHL
jgi:hypothetical protein